MVERNVDLQEAVDILTRMVDERVSEYLYLKSQLPSFGPEIDKELARYLTALEYFVQGTVVWYYRSPSWFFPPWLHGISLTCRHQDISLEPMSTKSLNMPNLKSPCTSRFLSRVPSLKLLVQGNGWQGCRLSWYTCSLYSYWFIPSGMLNSRLLDSPQSETISHFHPILD